MDIYIYCEHSVVYVSSRAALYFINLKIENAD
jgi:hypothetical protein